MSVDLSIDFSCCVISVIVCKCCSLSLAVPIANNPTSSLQHNYPNCCTDTQDQLKQTYWWDLFDWTFLFYIVHPCLTFQTVGVQNPKYDCTQLPCCRQNTWKHWDNTWMLGKWLISKPFLRFWNCPLYKEQIEGRFKRTNIFYYLSIIAKVDIDRWE